MVSELSMLGGPHSVVIDVDKGIAGIQGTQFYLSYGNPNIPGLLTGIVPNRYDFCINIDPSDAEYLFLYQYNYVPGTLILAWIPGFKLVPNTVAKNESATFVNGIALIQFQIELPPGYSSGTGGIPENYDIQFEISNQAGTQTQNPVSASYAITGLIVEDGIATINMGLSGIELVSGNWIPLSGDKVVHLIITVV